MGISWYSNVENNVFKTRNEAVVYSRFSKGSETLIILVLPLLVR